MLIYTLQLIESVVRGEHSFFDMSGVCSPPNEVRDVRNALRIVEDLRFRIQQLTQLVRSALHNESVVREAVNAAKSLYFCPIINSVQQVLNKELSASTCERDFTTQEIISTQFGFLSLESYVLATQYYGHRLMLCELISILGTLMPARDAFDLEQVVSEDTMAVASFASCVEYARREHHMHPVKALRLQLPLQVAFGAWTRRAPLTTHYGLCLESAGRGNAGEARSQEE
jgi:hypothetical protein